MKNITDFGTLVDNIDRDFDIPEKITYLGLGYQKATVSCDKKSQDIYIILNQVYNAQIFSGILRLLNNQHASSTLLTGSFSGTTIDRKSLCRNVIIQQLNNDSTCTTTDEFKKIEYENALVKFCSNLFGTPADYEYKITFGGIYLASNAAAAQCFIGGLRRNGIVTALKAGTLFQNDEYKNSCDAPPTK